MTLKLNIAFLDYLLALDAHKGKPPNFIIYWQHSTHSYPEQGWLDQGCLLLNWWLKEWRDLKAGAKQVTFHFFEGPYEMRVRFCEGTIEFLLPSKETWVVTENVVEQALVEAAHSVIRHLEAHKGFDQEVQRLSRSLALLTQKT